MSGKNISIVKIRENFKISLEIMRRYQKNYPGYYPALAFNWLQYAYSYVPAPIERALHSSLARLKRLAAK